MLTHTHTHTCMVAHALLRAHINVSYTQFNKTAATTFRPGDGIGTSSGMSQSDITFNI